MADIGGVTSILTGQGTGVLAPTSPFTSSNLLTGDTMQAIQGIDQTTKAKKPTTLAKTDATPISGQPNDNPQIVDPATFGIDGYRNGNPADPSSEGLNARTLASNDEEQIASMTLSQPSVNGSKGILIDAYTRFFLQSVSEPEQEKYQVVETFTGFYAFFFGKRPPIYRYSGVLLSDPNYRWNNDFKYIYENFFRGTSAVELNAEVIITYDGRVVTGFPLSLTMQQDAMNDKGMPFAMDILVVSHDHMSFSIDIDSLLKQKLAQLADLRNKIGKIQNNLVASGHGTLLSDQVTNQLRAPSSVGLPSLPPGAAGIVNQLGLA